MTTSSRLTRAALAVASAACLLAPFLFWVGRGECGWTCYAPVAVTSEPSRLADFHIGWHVAPVPSAGLVLLGSFVLMGLVVRRRFRVGDGVLGFVACVVAIWAPAAALTEGGGGQGYEKGGFVGAAGAAVIAAVLLARLVAPAVRSRRSSGLRGGAVAPGR